VTKSPRTTNFRHLLPVSKILRAKLDGLNIETFSKKTAPVKDRIKYWNIVPGDQIRLLGDRKKTLQEVTAINKFRNRVYVRGTGKELPTEGEKPRDKNYHYSRCQLFLGEHELPLKEGETERQVVPVFAQRLGTSPPVWNPYLRQWQWERFAAKTTPVIPNRRSERLPIPWPKKEPITHADATPYDTPKEEVMKLTYKPPPFAPTLLGLQPRIPTESEYLRALYNASHRPFFAGSQPPVEQFLVKELSNPHSRAKKMKRWQETRRTKRALLNEYIDQELKELNGRTRGEARAEAAFRWRKTLEEDKQALRKLRWVKRGGEEKLEKKIHRRTRKEEKQRQRLASLVLKPEPNQFIPKELSA